MYMSARRSSFEMLAWRTFSVAASVSCDSPRARRSSCSGISFSSALARVAARARASGDILARKSAYFLAIVDQPFLSKLSKVLVIKAVGPRDVLLVAKLAHVGVPRKRDP